MTSARRLPLWVTLVPLLLGIGAWYLAWSGWRDQLEADLLRLLPAGTAVEVGGFPYRLEARTGPIRLVHDDVATRASLEAGAMTVNRQPWRVDRQVINLRAPRIGLAVSGLSGLSVGLEAPAAQASLRVAPGHVARASMVFETPVLTPGFASLPVRAEALEVHLRETPVEAPDAGSATLPVQAQLVLAGRGLRLGEGDALALSAAIDLTAARPVRAVAAWRAGGTAELRELVVGDSAGEIARVSGTFSPGRDGRLLFAGTIETVCPASVRAALGGGPPVREKRTRKPVRLALTGVPGEAAEVEAAPAGAVAPPVRGQAPDCPRLR